MGDGSRDGANVPDWIRLGAAAELTKRYAAEGREFLHVLAMMLEGALPEETTITRKGGLFAKKTIQSVSVRLGDYGYVLEDPGRGPLRATRVHTVRGIALKTEETTVSEWIAEIGAALEERAESSAAAREALARLVW